MRLWEQKYAIIIIESHIVRGHTLEKGLHSEVLQLKESNIESLIKLEVESVIKSSLWGISLKIT